MKIAQVAPLYESVPPKLYGGTERVVSYLTEELVRQGHEVTLFASGDSVTQARLVAVCPRALRLKHPDSDQIVHHVLMVEKVFKEHAHFDLIHSHIDYFPYSMIRRAGTPALTTLHGRLDLPELMPLYREFSEIPVVSISEAQREPLPWIHWQGTVYHGLPENLYAFYEKPGKYLAFLGRASPEKRLDRAIEIAIRTEMPLKIAAKVDPVDKKYFVNEIKPLLNHPLIEFVGEISEAEKNEFLGNAFALLFPIDWSEPFGLVMIESMACGTPVISRACGSVPEILEPGAGFIVDTVEEAAEAVKKAASLDRRGCREVFERRFTATRMARDYLKIYEHLLAEVSHRR